LVFWGYAGYLNLFRSPALILGHSYQNIDSNSILPFFSKYLRKLKSLRLNKPFSQKCCYTGNFEALKKNLKQKCDFLLETRQIGVFFKKGYFLTRVEKVEKLR